MCHHFDDTFTCSKIIEIDNLHVFLHLLIYSYGVSHEYCSEKLRIILKLLEYIV